MTQTHASVANEFWGLLNQPKVLFFQAEKMLQRLRQDHGFDLVSYLAQHDDVDKLERLVQRGWLDFNQTMSKMVWFDEKAKECLAFFKRTAPVLWADVFLSQVQRTILEQDAPRFENVLALSLRGFSEKLFARNLDLIEIGLCEKDWPQGSALLWDRLTEKEKDVFVQRIVSYASFDSLEHLVVNKTYNWAQDDGFLWIQVLQITFADPLLCERKRHMLNKMSNVIAPDQAMLSFLKSFQWSTPDSHHYLLGQALEYLTPKGCFDLQHQLPHLDWLELGSEFEDKVTHHVLTEQAQESLQQQSSRLRLKL